MYEKYAILRDKHNLIDRKVAMATGIPQSTFSDWKSGRSNPKTDKLRILAKYFGVSIEYFLE